MSKLRGYLQRFEADIVRTCLIFRDPTLQGVKISKSEIKGTYKWLQTVLQAVFVAHSDYRSSYKDTQGYSEYHMCTDALYAPHLHSLFDKIGNESDQDRDVQARNLWLAAQSAIVACTSRITPTGQNSPPTIKKTLFLLIRAVRDYDAEVEKTSCEMYYYSARVLLALLAPLAPAFTNECWPLLHGGPFAFGRPPGVQVNQDFTLQGLDGRYKLPIKGQPNSLQSVFAPYSQPFTKIDLGGHSPDTRHPRRQMGNSSIFEITCITEWIATVAWEVGNGIDDNEKIGRLTSCDNGKEGISLLALKSQIML
ncbi:hypothetical protein V8F33_004986 [Rhypophila sp. PSN 637]